MNGLDIRSQLVCAVTDWVDLQILEDPVILEAVLGIEGLRHCAMPALGGEILLFFRGGLTGVFADQKIINSVGLNFQVR